MDFFKLKEMLETKVNGLEAKNVELETKNLELERNGKQLERKVWKLETQPNSISTVQTTFFLFPGFTGSTLTDSAPVTIPSTSSAKRPQVNMKKSNFNFESHQNY